MSSLLDRVRAWSNLFYCFFLFVLHQRDALFLFIREYRCRRCAVYHNFNIVISASQNSRLKYSRSAVKWTTRITLRTITQKPHHQQTTYRRYLYIKRYLYRCARALQELMWFIRSIVRYIFASINGKLISFAFCSYFIQIH